MVDTDDSIFSQCLTDSRAAEANVDCMPFSSSKVVNNATEEISSKGSANADLPAAVEVGSKYESTPVETGCPTKQPPDLFMTVAFVGTSESENSQQPELPESHAASEELVAKDLVTSDIGPGDIASKCALNNDIVEFSLESEICSHSSQLGVNTSATVSECPSKQPSVQVPVHVVVEESPMSPEDKDLLQHGNGGGNEMKLTSAVPTTDVSEDMEPADVYVDLSPIAEQAETHAEKVLLDVVADEESPKSPVHKSDENVQQTETHDEQDVVADEESLMSPVSLSDKNVEETESHAEQVDGCIVALTESSVVEQTETDDQLEGSTSMSSAATSVTDGNSTIVVDNSSTNSVVNDVHCSTEAESAGKQVLVQDKDPLKHGSDGDDVTMKEEASILSTSDVSDKVELDSIYIDLSSIADTVVDAVISDCLCQTSELDTQLECDANKSTVESGKLSPGTSELLNIANMVSETANSQSFAEDGEQVITEISKALSTETDDAIREDANASSSSSLSHEAEITDGTGSICMKQVEDEQCEQSSDVADVAIGKTGSSCENEPASDRVQKSISDFATENADQTGGLLAGNEETDKHLDSALENGAVSAVASNEQVVSLSLTEEETDNHKGEVTLEVSNGKSDVTVVSSANLTATVQVTEADAPESCNQPASLSCVIILKQPAMSKEQSTPGSTFAVPSSSDKQPVTTDEVQNGTIVSVGSFSAAETLRQLGRIIQQTTLSTSAANSVTSSTGTSPSVTGTHSTSTTNVRPAAVVAMNIGKNLVTEFVFREIVAHEAKWKNAAEKQKVN